MCRLRNMYPATGNGALTEEDGCGTPLAVTAGFMWCTWTSYSGLRMEFWKTGCTTYLSRAVAIESFWYQQTLGVRKWTTYQYSDGCYVAI